MRRERGAAMLARMVAFFGICGAMSAGCGGDSDGGGPVGLRQFSGSFADAFCRMLAPCCQDVGIPVDVARCRQSMEQNFQASVDSASPDNYQYDADAAGRCLDGIRTGATECAGLGGTSTSVNVACGEVFQGQLAPGAACASDIECSSDGASDVECDQGVCAGERRGVAGDSCHETCTEDGSLTTCSGTGSSMPGQGQCFTNDGLYCSESGACTAQASIGGACDTDRACSADAYCDRSTGTCATRLTEGQACTFNECAEGLYCKDAVCIGELAPGSPCAPGDRCHDGYCDEGTCAESSDLGDVGPALACAFLGGGLTTTQP